MLSCALTTAICTTGAWMPNGNIKGEAGVSVVGVSVDEGGYLVFTLSNGASTKTDKTLAEILSSVVKEKEFTVTYMAYINDIDVDLEVDAEKVADGARLGNPLLGTNAGAFKAAIVDALGDGYTAWWYKTSDWTESSVGDEGWAFNNFPALESLEVYAPVATSVTVNVQNDTNVKKVNVYAPKATTLSGSLNGAQVESLYSRTINKTFFIISTPLLFQANKIT